MKMAWRTTRVSTQVFDVVPAVRRAVLPQLLELLVQLALERRLVRALALGEALLARGLELVL
jgi:hypothetical protein